MTMKHCCAIGSSIDSSVPDENFHTLRWAIFRSEIAEPFAKLRFSFKIKACEKFYHRHMIDIPRIKFRA